MKNTLILPTMRGSLERMIDSEFNSFIDSFFNNALPTTLFREQNSFPQYNIKRVEIKQEDCDEAKVEYEPNSFIFEFALAGWKKEDLQVYTEKGTLVIEDISKTQEIDPDLYVRRGISTKHFTWKMNLPKYAEVTETSFENGLLSVKVEVKIPEEQKRKVIEIK